MLLVCAACVASVSGEGEGEQVREKNVGMGFENRGTVPSPQSPILLPRSLLFPFPTYAATQATFV